MLKKHMIILTSILIAFSLFIIVNNNLKSNYANTNMNESKSNDNNLISDETINNDSEISTIINEEVKNEAVINEEVQEYKLDDSNDISDTVLYDISEGTKNEIDNLIYKYYDTSIELATIDITSDAEKDKEQWIESLNKKREIIEYYKNVAVYTKPGLEKDSYIVFTTYEIKLNNIDTLVPGMSVLSVVKNEAGKINISIDTLSDDMNGYINELTKEEDIKKLILSVNTKLKDAINEDESLTQFIEFLKNI
jgi:hypothetical protein